MLVRQLLPVDDCGDCSEISKISGSIINFLDATLHFCRNTPSTKFHNFVTSLYCLICPWNLIPELGMCFLLIFFVSKFGPSMPRMFAPCCKSHVYVHDGFNAGFIMILQPSDSSILLEIYPSL